MAKHPTVDEMEKIILNKMCRVVEESGLGTGFTDEDLFSMLPDGAKRGIFDLALIHLIETRAIEENFGTWVTYLLSPDIYASYVENQDSENEESGKSEESDPWQPIKVEKYEEVAGKIEEFSTAIKSENGLRANYPDETDFMTETADATAKSLRDKEGVITRKRLSTVIEYTYKILKICDITTRIGEMASALIKFLTSFLS